MARRWLLAAGNKGPLEEITAEDPLAEKELRIPSKDRGLVLESSSLIPEPPSPTPKLEHLGGRISSFAS